MSSWRDILADIDEVQQRLAALTPIHNLCASPANTDQTSNTNESLECEICHTERDPLYQTSRKCFYCCRGVCHMCQIECQKCIETVVCVTCRYRCPIGFCGSFMVCHKHHIDSHCDACNATCSNDNSFSCSNCKLELCERCCVGNHEFALCWSCCARHDNTRRKLVFV
jgi:hypothetical protein